MNAPGRPAAFLDRDGVVNVDHGYVHRWEDFRFIDGSVSAMRRLQDAGYLLVVVTNQSGIARGLYTEADYLALTQQMRAHLATQGVTLAGVFHCPHLPDGPIAPYARTCDCRKPAPGLILQARDALQIDLPGSLLVGDKPSDIHAARAAGVGRAYLVQPPHGAGEPRADARFDSLADCVAHVLQGAPAASTLSPPGRPCQPHPNVS